MLTGMGQVEFDGMPEPGVLRLQVADGQVLVTLGRVLVYRYDSDDSGMRNLAIVALTDAGRRIDEVAAVFGLTATYVSMLRGRARTDGSAGLVRRRGRPPKLTDRQARAARELSAAGWSQQRIADRFGVARSVISELLARVGPAPLQDTLPESTAQSTEQTAGQPPTRQPRRPPRRRGPSRCWPSRPVPGRYSRVRPGSAPGRTAAGTPGRCCCMATWTGSAPRRSSPR